MASPDDLRAAPGVLRWVLLGIGATAALLVYLMGRRPPPAERMEAASGDRSAAGGAGGARGEGDLVARLQELREGGSLGRWRLVEIRDPQRGAIPLVLETEEGTRFRVDVLRRDPAGPRGPAETESLALHLSEVAPGTPTPEEHGLGAMTLASALAGVSPPSWLLTLGQRLARFPS